MNKIRKVFILLFGVMACLQVTAQDKIVNPDISYAGNPRNLIHWRHQRIRSGKDMRIMCLLASPACRSVIESMC